MKILKNVCKYVVLESFKVEEVFEEIWEGGLKLVWIKLDENNKIFLIIKLK